MQQATTFEFGVGQQEAICRHEADPWMFRPGSQQLTKTYAELAGMRGQTPSEANKAAAASRFRHLLEDLAEELAAKGARA